MNTNHLELPLSNWAQFRARCLGAINPHELTENKTMFNKYVTFFKCILWLPFCIPLVPTVVVLVALSAQSQEGFVLLSKEQSLNIMIGVMAIDLFLSVVFVAYAQTVINALGVLALFLKYLFFMGYLICDNVYQNLLNKNFKGYPFKERLKNREGALRCENALFLFDTECRVELYCCFKLCDAETKKDVLKWCNGSSERLQYRHLEELRARVLSQYENYGAYKKAKARFNVGVGQEKTLENLYNEMDELLAVYALHNRLEEASLAADPTVSHTTKKPRKI